MNRMNRTTLISVVIALGSLGLAIWGPKPVVVPGPAGDEVIRPAAFQLAVIA